jgi:hypothetical protein
MRFIYPTLVHGRVVKGTLLGISGEGGEPRLATLTRQGSYTHAIQARGGNWVLDLMMWPGGPTQVVYS